MIIFHDIFAFVSKYFVYSKAGNSTSLYSVQNKRNYEKKSFPEPQGLRRASGVLEAPGLRGILRGGSDGKWQPASQKR